MRKVFGCLLSVLAVGIIGIWMLWQFLPEVANVRPAALRTDCANRMRQLVLAMHSYHDFYGTLPPAVVCDEDGRPMHSWRALILPFIGSEKEFADYDYDQPWNSPGNLAVAERLKDGTFFCSELGTDSFWGGRREPETPFTSFVAVTGPGTAFEGDSKIRLEDFPDGTSRTILIVEFVNSDIQLLEPRDISAEEFIAAYERSHVMAQAFKQKGRLSSRAASTCELSRHNAGINVGLAKGTVRCISRATDPRTVRAITTIAGRDGANDF